MRRSDELVDQKLMTKAYAEVRKLLTKMFGKDSDGDSRVQFILIDRSRCWPMHFCNVPYEHKLKTKAELDDALRTYMVNAKIAVEALDTHVRTREYDERRIEKEEMERKLLG